MKLEQAVFGSLQRLPVQHVSLSLPHAMHWPPEHTAFGSHWFEVQHGSPGAPQFAPASLVVPPFPEPAPPPAEAPPVPVAPPPAGVPAVPALPPADVAPA